MNNEEATVDSQNDFVVTMEALTKCFSSGPEEVRAVDEVSVSLPRGKMIAVRGSSGSGKSTLLNLLGALDRPTSGQLLVDEVNVSTLSGRSEVDYRRRKVGFVFQSFNLIPQLSALENVMLPMDFIDINSHDQAERARRLMRQVGIDSKREHHRPAKLSGGQQQRVAIARALANDPPLILADEPTANLDAKTGRIIVDLLHGLCQEGRTVVVATHDTAIAHTADLILEMEDGRVIREHAPNRVRGN
jgi:ABC-type lipoprotein export system ATPase subunit